MQEPKPNTITGTTLVAEGHFIALSKLAYIDGGGTARTWEAVQRTGNGSRGAAFIIARIMPQRELVLIRQFRPPAGRLMLEFPAGLIDPGETAETTAPRELLEETGFQGRVIRIYGGGYSSPGMTGETITPVEMEIDGEYYKTNAPTPCPEGCEHIEVFRVPIAQLEAFITRMESEGTGIDSKLYTWLAAIRFQK